jgi:flavin reductase (DIM6/NTAB) family NADH-FMN oxidoreductase RutF
MVRAMSDAIAALVRSVNSPLVVVTASANSQTAGCVVGFHTQCSIEPVRYAVWLSKANHTYRVAMFATHVAVHFLDRADHALAARFGGTSGDDVDKFSGVDWSPGPGGAPLLGGCPNRLVMRRTSVWDDGSDHVCFVGEPVQVEIGRPDLVVMRVGDADDIEAGHDATSRATPEDLRGGELADDAIAELEDIAAGAGHAIDLDDPADDQPPSATPTDISARGRIG